MSDTGELPNAASRYGRFTGVARYGSPGGRTSGGSGRAQYIEPDPTVSPALPSGDEPYEMGELEQALTELDFVGFTLIKNVLSAEECAELLAIHEDILDEFGVPRLVMLGQKRLNRDPDDLGYQSIEGNSASVKKALSDFMMQDENKPDKEV